MAAQKKAPPYLDAPYELADANALQALARGEADSEQQKRALDWIIHVAGFTYQPTFFPGEPDASAFAAGRRFAGQQIVKMLSINTAVLKKET